MKFVALFLIIGSTPWTLAAIAIRIGWASGGFGIAGRDRRYVNFAAMFLTLLACAAAVAS